MGKKKWQNPAFFWSWRIAGFAREPILRSQRSQKRTVRMASEVGRCPPEVGSFRKTNRLRTRDFCDLPPKKLHDFWLQNSIRLNFYFAVSEWITSDMIYTMRSFQKLRFLKSSELHGFRHKLRGWKSLPPTFLVTGRPNLAVVGKHQIWSSLRCYKWLEGYLYDVLMDATWCNS